MPAAEPHPRRRRPFGRAVLTLLAAGLLLFAAGASPAGAQIDPGEFDDETETAETTTTGRNLLVSGDGSDGAESTTTSSTTVVEMAADDGLSEETQVWLIVAGLVVVALLIGVWTVRYWIRTRPDRR